MINKLRNEIDNIDKEIIELLVKRFEKTNSITKYKETVFDSKRENQIIDKLKNLNNNRLNNDFIDDLYKLILAESKRLQNIERNS
jgi:chorismate mutase